MFYKTLNIYLYRKIIPIIKMNKNEAWIFIRYYLFLIFVIFLLDLIFMGCLKIHTFVIDYFS